MPIAVVNKEFSERIELKSLPGGYVVIKKMSWGQLQDRRQMIMKMTLSNDRRNKGASVNLASEAALQFTFVNAIVEHNLEREEGIPLNFNNLSDFRALDPQIGDEIEKAIDKINDFDNDSDEEDDLKN